MLRGSLLRALAVAAFVAMIVVAAAYPEQNEGYGLLFLVVALIAGPIAVLCGLIVGIRVYGIHRSRIGRPAIAIVGILLLVWLGRSFVRG